MNVCTDFPNSQAAQVVFISSIPNKSGNSRAFPSSVTTWKGQFLMFPLPSSLHASWRPPTVMDLYLYLKSHRANTTVLCRFSSLSRSAASKASTGIHSGWARLHKQEVSSWSNGLTFSKACRIVAGRQDSSLGAHMHDCRTFPRPLCSPPRLTVRGWFFELLH